MTKIARMIVKWIASVALFWLSVMLAVTGCRVCIPFRLSHGAVVFLVAFAVGVFLFRWRKFSPVYVFGHEMTHWIVAKLFLKETGKFRVGMTKGSVEIADGNVWITLAPYIVPFYVLLAMGVFGLSQVFLYPSPPWAALAFVICAGLGYAYHCVLTVYAIGLSQSDLKVYGEFFSLSLIIAGNVLFLLLVLLLSNGQWRKAFDVFCGMSAWQWNIVGNLIGSLRR